MTNALNPSMDVYVCWLTRISLVFKMARCRKHDLNQWWCNDELPYSNTPCEFSQHQNVFGWHFVENITCHAKTNYVDIRCEPFWDSFLQNTHSRQPLKGGIWDMCMCLNSVLCAVFVVVGVCAIPLSAVIVRCIVTRFACLNKFWSHCHWYSHFTSI